MHQLEHRLRRRLEHLRGPARGVPRGRLQPGVNPREHGAAAQPELVDESRDRLADERGERARLELSLQQPADGDQLIAREVEEEHAEPEGHEPHRDGDDACGDLAAVVEPPREDTEDGLRGERHDGPERDPDPQARRDPRGDEEREDEQDRQGDALAPLVSQARGAPEDSRKLLVARDRRGVAGAPQGRARRGLGRVGRGIARARCSGRGVQARELRVGSVRLMASPSNGRGTGGWRGAGRCWTRRVRRSRRPGHATGDRGAVSEGAGHDRALPDGLSRDAGGDVARAGDGAIEVRHRGREPLATHQVPSDEVRRERRRAAWLDRRPSHSPTRSAATTLSAGRCGAPTRSARIAALPRASAGRERLHLLGSREVLVERMGREARVRVLRAGVVSPEQRAVAERVLRAVTPRARRVLRVRHGVEGTGPFRLVAVAQVHHAETIARSPVVRIVREDVAVRGDGALGLVGVAAEVCLPPQRVDDVRTPPTEDGRALEARLRERLRLRRELRGGDVGAEVPVETAHDLPVSATIDAPPYHRRTTSPP